MLEGEGGAAGGRLGYYGGFMLGGEEGRRVDVEN